MRPDFADGSEAGAGVARALAMVTRRGWIAGALTAGGAAFVVVAIGIASGWTWSGVGLGLAAAAVMLWRGPGKKDARDAARAIERASPECRNVVITAEELLRFPQRAAPWMRARVLTAATALVHGRSPAIAVPLGRPLVMFVVLVSAGGLILAGSGRRASDAVRGAVSRVSRAGVASASAPLRIVVTVTPPAYTALSPRDETNPERLEAIQGSRVRLVITGPALGMLSCLVSNTIAGASAVK